LHIHTVENAMKAKSQPTTAIGILSDCISPKLNQNRQASPSCVRARFNPGLCDSLAVTLKNHRYEKNFS